METNQKSHTIELSQEFSVPVEELFKAWTEAEHLKQWWHPMDSSLENVKNELQEGGAVEYEFESKDFIVKGNYKEVQINQKLVYSWNWEFSDNLKNEDYTLTISFEPNDNGSTIHVKQEGLASEEVAPPHEEGWKAGLDSLKAYLDKSEETSTTSSDTPASDDNLKSDEGMSDRSGGYNEAPEQVKVGGA